MNETKESKKNNMICVTETNRKRKDVTDFFPPENDLNVWHIDDEYMQGNVVLRLTVNKIKIILESLKWYCLNIRHAGNMNL